MQATIYIFTNISIDKTQRIVDGKIERRQQKISIESTTDTAAKKNVEKKEEK